MADPPPPNSEPPKPPTPTRTPPLDNAKQENPEDNFDPNLDETLRRLESFLALLGFRQSSALSFGLSWVAFSLVGIVLPVIVIEFSCSDCEKYRVRDFELDVVASQACLAAVSLLCLSHNLRKYGIRKFLFVDRHSGQMVRFRNDYIQKVSDSLRLLVSWMLPCFILKTAREVARSIYDPHESWWLSIFFLFALVISWTYMATIYLSACIMFYLVCNLQVIHFDDFGKSLERECDITKFIEEHIRLRYHLSKISHRFRIYLLLAFLAVTASQFVTLYQTTGYDGTITFINGGDFAVSSIVQVVGIIFCLNAAAKISHRAQGIASLASRWHAMVTCSPTDASQMRASNSSGNLEAGSGLGSLKTNYSESDLESMDYVTIPTTAQLAASVSAYHKRQAFVMYLQTNPGGLTIFGWTVDRGLMIAIFFVEIDLVLFVLDKTIFS